MKYLMIGLLSTCALSADRGGAFAGGLLTGAVLGTVASAPRRTEVVYVNDSRSRDDDYEDQQEELERLRAENRRLKKQQRAR